MIFVDTSAWYADLINDDECHASARAFVQANKEAFFTTDFVVTELLNLLVVRGYADRAREVARTFFSGQTTGLEWVSRDDIERALNILEQYKDKQWSFTDCVSFAVIERLAVKRTFSFDDHFRQFGSVEVVP